MGDFLNKVRDKNNRTASRKVNDDTRGATLVAGDPRGIVVTDGTLTDGDWTELKWTSVATGEGAITFQLALTGEEDGSGNVSTGDLDFQVFKTKGEHSGTTAPGAYTVEDGEWAVVAGAATWTQTTYRVQSLADAYEVVDISFPADALQFGIRVRRHAGETSDIVYNVEAHIGLV